VRSGSRRASPTARQPESPEAAYAEAVKRLARQPQSRAALALRLARLGYAEDAVRGALERAQADGYLDDREFAASVVRRRSQGRGHAMIAQELRALSLGRALLARKRPANPEELRAIVAPRLSRRGFSSGLVYRTCLTLSDEWQAAGAFDRV